MTLAAGTELEPFVVESVPAKAMRAVAELLGDPNPIHLDRDAVRRLGLGDRAVNQGTSNLAYIANMLIAWTGSAAAVRHLRVRFLENVYEGDRVVSRGRVVAVRGNEVDLDVWLERDGARVLDGTAVVRL